MPFDPDTEIQYRKGGKIMKKTPRKFNTGGMAPAPTPKPAPKGGPKELQEEARRLKEEARAKQEQEAGQRRPNLGLKKGGKVKKFGEGGDVTQDTRERRADERKEPAPIESRTSPEAPKVYNRPAPLPSGNEARDAETATNPNTKFGRFSDDTYSKAYAQANRLTTPSGEVEKEVKANTGLKEPPVPKAAPKVAPKVAPKAAPKKSTPESDNPFKRGFDQSNAEDARLKRLGKKPESSKPETSKAEAPFNPFEKDFAALKGRRGSRAEDIYPSLMGKKAGGVVKKYAKGGGIESKGKTTGKIVKMAKGGSARGYGISKVTNKTKYC
jgi:hypothetical protein